MAEKEWYKKWWGSLSVVVLAFVLIVLTAFGFYIFDAAKRIKQYEADGQKSLFNSRLAENQKLIYGDSNYWIGAANPKIIIVEFFDFACPYCQKSFPVIREIGSKYKDSVKIIVRDYPLHDNSVDLALAGRCAGEQGLFWLMHDKLFAKQGVSAKEELIELANQIGADKTKFTACFESKKYLPQIRKDFTDGQSLEIAGTPTWFINGYRVEGDVPMETWEKIIQNFK